MRDRSDKLPAEALLDDCDRHLLGDYLWHIDRRGYVRRNTTKSVNGKPRYEAVYLHRIILGAGPLDEVDHINGIRSDNRRCNLRFLSHADNSRNKRPFGRSGVLGVHWHGRTRKWQVAIKRDGKFHYFGLYHDIDEAKRVAREALEKLSPGIVRHGELA